MGDKVDPRNWPVYHSGRNIGKGIIDSVCGVEGGRGVAGNIREDVEDFRGDRTGEIPKTSSICMNPDGLHGPGW